MTVCGWCAGKEQTCPACSSGRKPFFPKKAKRRVDDTLKSGHKHGNDKFIYETKTAMWFECNCGQAHKISL